MSECAGGTNDTSLRNGLWVTVAAGLSGVVALFLLPSDPRILLTVLVPFAVGLLFFATHRAGSAARRTALQQATAAQEALEALRESEQRLRTLLEQTPAALWTADRELRFTSISGRVEPTTSIVGLSLLQVLDGGDLPWGSAGSEHSVAIEAHRQALSGQRADYQIELGGIVYRSTVGPLKDRYGEITGVIGVAVDVTAGVRAARELRESRRRLHDIVEHSTNVFYSFAVDGSILYLSSQVWELLGYEPSEITNIRQLLPGNRTGTRARAAVARALSTGDAQPAYEVQVESRGGKSVWLELREAPVVKEGKAVAIVGAAADITDRIRAEAERDRATEELRQVQKLEAIGRLAGGVAHDFNNLLTAIGGYAELLRIRLADRTDMLPDLEEIERAVRSAASLTGQLLAFSRRQALQPKILDPNREILELERMLRRLIGEDVELHHRLQDGVGHVEVDPGKLQQVLLNLAVNARDAMPYGGVLTLATADLEVGTDPLYAISPGHYVVIEVTDTGLGMDSTTLKHAFEPFFTTKDPGQGIGLGLSTVYGIVKQSGGFVLAESEPGEGATLRIYLPRCDRRPKEEAPAKQQARLGAGDSTILVAEDDPAVLSFVCSALRREGYRVFAAQSGAEARALSSRLGALDLLLTDVVMADSRGPEVARDVAASHPAVRVLYMSGHVGEATKILPDGADFLPKPFGPAALLGKLEGMLA